MATIELNQKYALTNDAIGDDKVLASTRDTDQLIIEDAGDEENKQWYFTDTDSAGYYRIHTVQKGADQVLDNYHDLNEVNNASAIHFFNLGPYQGQYWQFDEDDDGSVKISNKYSGSDILLSVTDDEPGLVQGDAEGQQWTLNKLGALPTNSASNTASRTASITSLRTSITRSSNPTGAARACASSAAASCTATAAPSDDGGLSREAKIGIGAGVGVGGGLLAIGLLIWLLSYLKRRRLQGGGSPTNDHINILPRVGPNN